MRRTRPVAPFLTAAAESVRPDSWRVADTEELLADRLDHWDPALILRLDRTVTLEVDEVLASTRTTDPAGLAVAAVWKSDRTRLRGRGMTVPLAGREGEATVRLSLDVPGRVAGGSLELQTALVRTVEGEETTPITARRPGSVLWSDRVVVALEGAAARFPVTALDFGAVTGIASGAAWTLEWSPHDLDEPVLGAMRLLINSANPAVLRAVGGDGGAEGLAIVSMIHFDVARCLVHGALRSEEFVGGPREFEADTVGRMLCDLLDRVWPGVAPASLAGRALDAPHRLESELQQATGLLAP